MKLIKIVLKSVLGIAFLVAGEPRIVSLDPNLAGPICFQTAKNNGKLIEQKMVDPQCTDEEILHDIETFRQYLTNPELEVPEHLRDTWKRYTQAKLDELNLLSEDLKHHRIMGMKYRNMSGLLEAGKPFYEELRQFIASAKLPFHLEEANNFKENLIDSTICTIKLMVLDPEKQFADIMPIIENLRNFIEQEDKLPYKGEDKLPVLEHISENFDTHRKISIKIEELNALIGKILDADLETEDRIAQEVRKGLEELQGSVGKPHEIYKEELNSLKSRLEDLLKHNKHRRLMDSDPEYRRKVEDAINSL